VVCLGVGAGPYSILRVTWKNGDDEAQRGLAYEMSYNRSPYEPDGMLGPN